MARSLRSLRQVATLRHGHMARRSASLRSCIHGTRGMWTYLTTFLKYRSELIRSDSKIWYVDLRTNSDFRSRSFDIIPPTRERAYTGYAPHIRNVSANVFSLRRFGIFFLPKRPPPCFCWNVRNPRARPKGPLFSFFSAMRDFLRRKILQRVLFNVLTFCNRMDVGKSQRVPPFSFFRHCEIFSGK